MNSTSTLQTAPDIAEEPLMSEGSISEYAAIDEQPTFEQSVTEPHISEAADTPPDFTLYAPSLSTAPKEKAKAINLGTLYVVSTPIGNNEDISLRAIKTLKQADVVIGEEGKTVARLLHEHRITKKLAELNEHNENEQTRVLMQMLKSGKTLALVSDAGTPLLADPGAQLVRKAIEAGIPVRAIPGVTSILTALTTSGLPMDSFLFAGFVSREPGERLQELKRLAQEPRTVALLETPYRLVPLLEAARQIMPQRRAYLGCNLTMDSETHHYGTVSELYTKFVVSRFKGEFVFCFEGVKGAPSLAPQAYDDRDNRRERKPFHKEGGFRREANRDGSNRDTGFKGKSEGGNRDGSFKRDAHRENNNRDTGFKGRPEAGNRDSGFKGRPEAGSRDTGFKGRPEAGSRDGNKQESSRSGFQRGGRPDGARGGGHKREGNFRREGGDKSRSDKPQGNQPQNDTPKSE